LSVETGEVRAEGVVLQAGRRLAYCEARLTDAAGKLIAHGTGSCLIFPRT
jgi:acyl-coenzyme A thioesterase PaaI-like protein